MNEALKSAIDEAFDIEALVKDAVAKNWTGTLGDLIKGGTDLPVLIGKASALLPDLQALMANPAADADLLAYVQGKVGGESAAAQKVLVSAVDLLITLAALEPKVVAMIDAVKGAAAPAPAPAA